MPRNIYLPFALLLLLVFVVAGCEGIEKAPGEHTLKLTKPTHSDQLVFDDENIQAKLLARKVIDGDMKELVKNAREAMGNSYSPYSRFAVGAAVRTSSGKVFQGCNIENCSYGLTICAERVA
ncbi:MAG: cytidine deaminase, partial [Planctomycetes bacterium]|nr:cytidine deaminase [Planctomycetota bacterium]